MGLARSRHYHADVIYLLLLLGNTEGSRGVHGAPSEASYLIVKVREEDEEDGGVGDDPPAE